MTSDDNKKTKPSLAARLKLALAGLALAGALAGGAVAVVDSDPVGVEDTTETARSWWVSARAGISWQ